MNKVFKPGGLIAPSLHPREIKIFLAEDAERKRAKIMESLGRVGLDSAVHHARSLEEAKDFIAAQEPRRLTANVFLLDGNLDPTQPGDLDQGHRLSMTLWAKYYKAMGEVQDAATQQLHHEALLIGISSVRKGGLHPEVAQIPWAPYDQVGGLILDAVAPQQFHSNVRKEITD